MTIGIPYPNARDTANAVLDAIPARPQQVSQRPWNMHEPDTTFWWLVPSTDWPAYKHGKLFFDPDRAPAGQLLCGLNVEKGLDAGVAEAYPSAAGQRYIMQSDWLWFAFIADLASSKVGSAITQLHDEIDAPVTIRLEASVVDDPGTFSPYATQPDKDIAIFESAGTALTRVSSQTPLNVLTTVAGSQTLGALAASIRSMPNADWVWLDVFIGAHFARERSTGTPGTWNASRLWAKALAMWMPWFR